MSFEKKAEAVQEQLAEANRQAEANRVCEDAIAKVREQAEDIGKHSQELNQRANDKLAAAIARAEEAERQATARVEGVFE